MLSKSCEHGIKAVIYIARQSLEGKRVKIGDVAANTGTPEAFTAKILGALTKHNLLSSVKGPYGGFEIDTERMQAIRLSDIINAIDGDSLYNGCVLGLSECSLEHPCPMHDSFLSIRAQLKQTLESTSIYELATALQSGKTVLTRKPRLD